MFIHVQNKSAVIRWWDWVGPMPGADGPENFKTQRLLQNLMNH